MSVKQIIGNSNGVEGFSILDVIENEKWATPEQQAQLAKVNALKAEWNLPLNDDYVEIMANEYIPVGDHCNRGKVRKYVQENFVNHRKIRKQSISEPEKMEVDEVKESVDFETLPADIIEARLYDRYSVETPANLQCEEIWQLYKKVMYSSMQTEAQFLNFSHNHKVEVDFFGPLMDKVKSMFPNSDTVMNKVVEIISLCGIAFRHLADPPTLYLCCLNLAGCLGLAYSAMGAVTGLLAKALNCMASSAKGKPRAQNGDVEDTEATLWKYIQDYDILKATTYMAGVGFTVLVGLFLKKLPGKQTIDEMMTRVKHLPGTVKSAGEIQQFGEKMCHHLIAGVRKAVFGLETFDAFSGVKEWFDEVSHLMSVDSEIKIKNDPVYQMRADAAYIRGLNIAKDFDAMRIPADKQAAFRYHLMACARLRELAHNSGAGYMKPRIEPLVIQLWGASGVGKSVLTNLICIDMLKSQGLMNYEDMINAIYYRKVGMEYWDGFSANHKIVVYDDFGALKDVPGVPNAEFLEIIHGQNNAPYMAHMADLQSKATTPFRAMAVVATSNCPDYDMPSMSYPAAVRRRFEIRARIRVKPEYAKKVLEHFEHSDQMVNRVDRSKLVEGAPLFEPYLFDLVDPEAVEAAGIPTDFTYKGITYPVFMQHVLKALANKQDGGRRLLDDIAAYARLETIAQIHTEQACGSVSVEREARAEAKHVERIAKIRSEEARREEEARLVREAALHQDQLREKVKKKIDRRKAKFQSAFQERMEQYRRSDEHDAHTDYQMLEEDVNMSVPTWWQKLFHYVPGLASLVLLITLMTGHGCSLDMMHIHMRDYPALDVPLLDIPNDLPSPTPVQMMMFGSLMDADCFRIPRLHAVNFVVAVKTARINSITFVAPGELDYRRRFVQVLVSILGETVNDERPIPCAKRCDSKFEQLKKNADWMFEEGIANTLYAHLPEVSRDAFKGKTKEEFESAITIASAVQFTLTLLASWYFVKFLYYLAKAVYLWFKGDTSSVVSEVKLVAPEGKADVEISWLEKLGFSGSVEPVESESKVYVDEKGNAATVKALAENSKVYVDDKGNAATVKALAEGGKAYVDDKGNAAVIKTMSEGMVAGSVQSFVNTNTQRIVDAVKTDAHGAFDENATTLYGKLLANSIYKLEALSTAGEWRHLMNITFLYGRVAITNKHLLYFIRKQNFIRIRGASCMDGAVIATKELMYSTARDDEPKYAFRDVALIAFPNSIRQHPNIMNHICDVDDFSRFTEVGKAALIGFVPHKDVITRVYVTKNVRAVDTMLDMSASLGQPLATVCIRDHFEYDLETQSGECGMLLISMNPAHMRKILGIHCSGQKHASYQGNATPISKEFIAGLSQVLLEAGLRKDAVISNSNFDDVLIPVVAQVAVIEDHIFEVTTEKIGDHFSIFGRVKDPVYAGGSTEIRPSPIGEAIVENKTAPARLKPFSRDGVRIDPVKLALKKADVAPTYVDRDILAACVQDVLSLYESEPMLDRRVLTLDEAIKGVDENPLMPSISRSSSPGYPWIHQRTRGKGKEQWLGQNEEWNISPTFIEKYEQRMEKARNLEREPTVWVDTLKDERRPIQRVRDGKTRLFAVGEMTFNVAVRQYFLPVAAHIMRHRVRFESCVGINPYSVDWQYLAQRMRMKGKRIVAGDYSNFDGSLLGPFLWAVFDIFAELMQFTEEEHNVACTLWSDMVHANHLCHDVVYGWNHSQPSGCSLTVILNSVVNSLIVRYCWMLVMQGTEWSGMRAFNQHVVTGNYGDDNWINISGDVIDKFNMHTITEAFAKFGFTYTDEHKSKEVEAFRTMDDISFLKRKIEYNSEFGRWTSPLSLDTILEMAQWVRGKENHHELCALNMETAVYELSQHSREVFNQYFPLFREAAKLLIVRPVFETYDMYQEMDGIKYLSLPWLK